MTRRLPEDPRDDEKIHVSLFSAVSLLNSNLGHSPLVISWQIEFASETMELMLDLPKDQSISTKNVPLSISRRQERTLWNEPLHEGICTYHMSWHIIYRIFRALSNFVGQGNELIKNPLSLLSSLRLMISVKAIVRDASCDGT